MESFIFGLSSQRLPIVAHRFGAHGKTVLVLGGVHGDETEGVVAALGLLDRFRLGFDLRLKLTLIPSFNIDGVLAKTRGNARGVDLNRNLPTKDWSPEIATPRYHPGPHAASEPENQALIEFIKIEKPSFVMSLHSWKPMLNINGDCRTEAEAIHATTGYEISPTVGYSTPGCLGTYCGLEKNTPTLTYEIERGLAPEQVLRLHVPAMLDGLRATEKTERVIT